MICLGIESTAHTLGVGIVDGEHVLANEKDIYRPKFEGIHPRKAADHHEELFEQLLRAALAKANVKLREVGLIAFAQGPGIGAPLRVGCAGARALSVRLKKPIIGVNHCVAHIEISKLYTKTADPLVVYVSGGNTQIIVKHEKRYQVIGETLDVGLGNLLDTFGRSLKLEHAHGGVIEQLARTGTYVELPYVVKGMDLSFSGLLTEAQKKLAQGASREDMCYSLQEVSFSMLTEASERALALTGKRELIMCGGVAQNKRLQQMLEIMGKPHGARFGVAPNEFNADNGAMIAYTGLIMHGHGKRTALADATARQRFRTDEVELW